MPNASFNPRFLLNMHKSLENFEVLDSGNLDILLRTRNDVHLPATKFSHKRTRGNRVGDTTLGSLFVSGNEVAQAECLRSLCTYEFVTRNTCSSCKTIITLEYSLTTFYTSNRITIFLAYSDIGGYDIL